MGDLVGRALRLARERGEAVVMGTVAAPATPPAGDPAGRAPVHLAPEPGAGPLWPPTSPCPVCRDGRFWLSIYGVTVCATCHPPAAPDLGAAEATAPGGPLR